tara:strand:+ start:1105 stop:1971 length:867 start_codon:yes stop_codon:yes gene_type:complete
MKGIILSGGLGTRLYPLTLNMSKQLLPVYDKPMIFYPVTTLMKLGINDLLIITSQEHLKLYKKLFFDFSSLGLKIKFLVQDRPNGIAECFLIAKNYIKGDNVALILGDNFFYGYNFENYSIPKNKNFGAQIFAYEVENPNRYGVIEFNKKNRILKIVEKPKETNSSHVVTGLYFYDQNIIKIASSIKPSKRGELEISDVNNMYLKKNKLKAIKLSYGSVWLDTGTFDSLIQTSLFVQTIQKRQKQIIGSPHITAYQNKWISKSQLEKIINKLPKSPYTDQIKDYLDRN